MLCVNTPSTNPPRYPWKRRRDDGLHPLRDTKIELPLNRIKWALKVVIILFSHINAPDLTQSRLVYLRDGRCSNSNTPDEVLMVIIGHSSTLPEVSMN
ncbi:unnamed protein product [Larinioides sclopetarius]|uniref:Uncharacterized protein n=1 Tax=Larinioides sclopetarius TaxID=280406 RepID=A0AAV1ZJ21_9ARAC